MSVTDRSAMILPHSLLQVAELEPRLECLRAAFAALVSSEAIRAILGLLLSLGNALNTGTHRSGAVGFRLEMLPQLASMRCQSSAGSLLGTCTMNARVTKPPRVWRSVHVTEHAHRHNRGSMDPGE